MFQEFTGREYLQIDIANNWGLDKLDWKDRLSWFQDNEHQLDSLLNQAKEPALYYAACKAWRDVQAGRPIGYMISLDATSSGLQLLAALTGDHLAARLCNVVDTGQREDAYLVIYQAMLRVMKETAKISRDDVKDAIMTALYSSKAVPKRVFGENTPLLGVFYQALEHMAPAAWELNEAMLALWNPNTDSHDWVLPDNFHVRIKVMSQAREVVHFLNEPFEVTYMVNAPMDKGRSLGANTIHSLDGMIVREMTRRCDYDPVRRSQLIDLCEAKRKYGSQMMTEDDKLVIRLWQHYQDSGYLSARILDHLNEDNFGIVNKKEILELLDSMPTKPFKIVSIHDCFRCLPHYGNDLRRQYTLQLQLIAKSELLSFIVSQLVGKKVVVNKLDPLLYQQIGATNYALS